MYGAQRRNASDAAPSVPRPAGCAVSARKRRPIIAPDLGGEVDPASLFVAIDGDGEVVGFVEGPRETVDTLRLFDEPEPPPPGQAEHEAER